MFGKDIQFPFYNASGGTIPAFSVFRVDGVEEINGAYYPKAKQPNAYGSQYSHYINGPTDVPDEGMGSFFGVFPCLAAVNGSPTKGDQIGPRSGQWDLRASTYGFRVVDLADSGFAIVEREPMLQFTGKYNSSCSKGSTGTVSIYYPSSGTLTDTTQDMSSVLAVSQAFTSSDWANVVWINGRWEAYLRECPS